VLKPVRIRAVQAAHFIYNKNTLTIPSTKLLYTRTPRAMTVHFAHTLCYLCLALGINRDYLREHHYPVNVPLEKVYCAAKKKKKKKKIFVAVLHNCPRPNETAVMKTS